MITLISIWFVGILTNIVCYLLKKSHNFYQSSFKLYRKDVLENYFESGVKGFLEDLLFVLVTLLTFLFPFAVPFIHRFCSDEFTGYSYSTNWKYGQNVKNKFYEITQIDKGIFNCYQKALDSDYYKIVFTNQSFSSVIANIEHLENKAEEITTQDLINFSSEFLAKIDALIDIKKQFINKFKK